MKKFADVVYLVTKRDQLASATESGYVDRCHLAEVSAIDEQIQTYIKKVSEFRAGRPEAIIVGDAA